MQVTGIDHINITTTDLDRLCAFYSGVLGMEVGDRPPFSTPGAWIYAGGHPVLHVGIASEAPRGDTQPVDHYALAAEGFAEMKERLDAAGVEHQVFDVPGRAMRQIFVHDPDGVAVELNFSHPDDVGTEPNPVDVPDASRRR